MNRLLQPIFFVLLGFLLVAAAAAPAALLPPANLAPVLRQGGHVLVIRHADSPSTLPDAKSAEPDNVKRERQLSPAGRDAAIAMGRAIRDLKIPVGEVLVSPAYRTRQTARLAQLANPKIHDELTFEGTTMTETVTPAQTAWLKARAAALPKGTNTFIVTHSPNLAQAFPDLAPALAAGEAAVFGADASGRAKLIARLKIEEWAKLQ